MMRAGVILRASYRNSKTNKAVGERIIPVASDNSNEYHNKAQKVLRYLGFHSYSFVSSTSSYSLSYVKLLRPCMFSLVRQNNSQNLVSLSLI